MSRFTLKKQTAPGTPPTGYTYFYVKDDGKVYSKNDNGQETALGVQDTKAKSILIEQPANNEDLSIFFTSTPITVTKMTAVLVGSATPSVTWTIRHSTDRSAAGNEVVTGGTVTTSTTTGSDITAFDDPTIPADSYVWVETTAKSGTVLSILITIEYTED